MYNKTTDYTKPIINLNVSGKNFQTHLLTLQRFPNTLLGNPEMRARYYNEEKDEYFFDRNRKGFSAILYFYQSNGVLECPLGVSEKIFLDEVIFFGLAETTAEHRKSQHHEISPKNPFLRMLFKLFEQPNSSLPAKVTASISIVFTVLSIIFFCVETIPNLNPDLKQGCHTKEVWFILNSICNGWFTFEFFIRVVSNPKKKAFITSPLNIIDLLSVFPYYITLFMGTKGSGGYIVILRVLRVFRVVRIFKLTRHSLGLHILGNTIKASCHELIMLAMFLAIGVILFSSAVYFAEYHEKETEFISIPHTFWWAVVTMTTVGYGDIAPKTLTGKLVGALCAISGVLVIALPVPVIVSNFERFYKEAKGNCEIDKAMAKKKKVCKRYQGITMLIDKSFEISDTVSIIKELTE